MRAKHSRNHALGGICRTERNLAREASSATAASHGGARSAERAQRAAKSVVAARSHVTVVTGPSNLGNAIAVAHVRPAPRRKRVRERGLAFDRHLRPEKKSR